MATRQETRVKAQKRADHLANASIVTGLGAAGLGTAMLYSPTVRHHKYATRTIVSLVGASGTLGHFSKRANNINSAKYIAAHERKAAQAQSAAGHAVTSGRNYGSTRTTTKGSTSSGPRWQDRNVEAEDRAWSRKERKLEQKLKKKYKGNNVSLSHAGEPGEYWATVTKPGYHKAMKKASNTDPVARKRADRAYNVSLAGSVVGLTGGTAMLVNPGLAKNKHFRAGTIGATGVGVGAWAAGRTIDRKNVKAKKAADKKYTVATFKTKVEPVPAMYGPGHAVTSGAFKRGAHTTRSAAAKKGWKTRKQKYGKRGGKRR